MSVYEKSEYACDKCGKSLPTSNNSLEIVTNIREDRSWSRLHVTVEHHHGVNNDAEIEKADLCQRCAVSLIRDALKRINSGERSSAGMESVEAQRWESK